VNLKEGTRRLAVLLGAVGAVAGGFASCLELQSVLSQRARHVRFESFANSDVVRQERKSLQVPGFGPPETSEPNDWQDVPIPTNDGPLTVIGPDGKTYHFPEGTDKDAAIRYFKMERIGTGSTGIVGMDDPIHRDGIEIIHWTKDFAVASIETADGQTLYPTPAPGAGLYLLMALLPILGFLIPWGAVRAIGWVGVGFIANSK
jgi:hypothetical protein